ncbi:MAG: hypothetical protein AAF805_12715 [Planctomycetota bacterium]
MSNAPVAARRVVSLSLALAAVSAGVARAQTYESLPVDKTLARKAALIKRDIRNPSGDPGAKQELEAYFDRYFFPAMTQHTDKALEKLGGSRIDLFKGFLWVASGDTYRTVYGKATRFAVGVLRSDKFHPAVRYNALLILGMLDSQPAGADGTPPTPDERANGMMCQLVGRAMKSASRPRYELVGSLIGLERHTRFFDQLSAKAQQRTSDAMVQLLVAKELAGEYQRGVRPWVYTLAAQSLGNTGKAGPRGQRFRAIARRLGDDTLGTTSRSRLAAQLQRLDTEGVTIDASEAVQAIRTLAAEIGRRESKLATQFEDLRLGGRGGRVRAGQPTVQTRNKTAHRFRPTENGYQLVRPGLVDLLTDLRAGVRAVGRVAAAADRESLAEIDAAVNAALMAASNEDEGDLKVADAIKSMAGRIDAVVDPAAAEAEDFAAR